MADKVTDGLKHDGEKYRLDLVPPEIIEAVGGVMTHGIDEDSGFPHLWHIACNVAFLLELDKEQNGGA